VKLGYKKNRSKDKAKKRPASQAAPPGGVGAKQQQDCNPRKKKTQKPAKQKNQF